MTRHYSRSSPDAPCPDSDTEIMARVHDAIQWVREKTAAEQAEFPQSPLFWQVVNSDQSHAIRKPHGAQGWQKTWRTTAAVIAMSSIGFASVAADTAPAFTESAPRSAIDIRVGRNKSSGRIEVYGSIGARASIRREGVTLILRLPSPQKPDLGDIRANMPIGVASVDYHPSARYTELVFTLKDGYDARFGRSDGGVFAQIDPKDRANSLNPSDSDISVDYDTALKEDAAASSANASATTSLAPAKNGPVPVEVADYNGGKIISFTFGTNVPAAVFRRGDAVWIVFDTDADLKLPIKLKDGQIIQNVAWARSDGFTAMRITAPAAGALSAQNKGVVWRIVLGAQGTESKADLVSIEQDRSSGSPAIAAHMSGASRVAYIKDPSIGDRLAVVTALGPVKRVSDSKTTPQASIMNTAQGMAIERIASDVKIKVFGDNVEISRPGGLSLSLPANGGGMITGNDPLQYRKATYPSLMDATWSETPNEGFLNRYIALQTAAADEAKDGPNAPYAARLNLARFLIGQGMYFEAQGLLNLTAHQVPKSTDDPQLRGLRASATVMSGRYAEAMRDLTAPSLGADPSARLWQAYAESESRNYAEAVKSFQLGASALNDFPPIWRTRIAASAAFAALKLNDLEHAEALGWIAVKQPSEPLDQLQAYLVLAQIFEAKGEKERALAVYNAVSNATFGKIAVPAIMHAAKLNYDLKKASPEQTLATMDSLRFRWRGDDSELDVIKTMGDIYLSLGRYRDALTVLKSAGNSFKDQPKAVEIHTMLNDTFRQLFLGGMADGLQPIEALALFKDFQELTPVGADGDEMVRKIVQRLVSVDLLDQAAELLEYQVNNRLEGPAKAAIASNLAAIYLMNRDPQKALQALWNTRTTLLPKTILAERRILEARALNELNQGEKALDVLGNDASNEAQEVRADVYWKQHDYAKAGAISEKLLGARWKNPAPLSTSEENYLLRAAVAYSLQSDQASLTRLSDRFLKYAADAVYGDAMRVALAPIENGPISVKDFSSAAMGLDSFASWVDGMKKKFRERVAEPVKAAAAPAKAAMKAG